MRKIRIVETKLYVESEELKLNSYVKSEQLRLDSM